MIHFSAEKEREKKNNENKKKFFFFPSSQSSGRSFAGDLAGNYLNAKKGEREREKKKVVFNSIKDI